MSQISGEGDAVRCMLIPLERGQLLLPAATVVEVIAYREPAGFAPAPGWLLGSFPWQQRQIPLISFVQAISAGPEAVPARARIVLCKAPGGDPDLPYLALIAQAIPHMVRVDARCIEPEPEPETLGPLVLRQVRINGESAWIPELEALAALVREALGRVDYSSR